MSKSLVGAAILTLALPATADAQIVKVGPLGGVSVRVPFVSVDVSPWGGTRVRAPFTSVNTPGRGFIAPGGFGYGYGAYEHGAFGRGAPLPDYGVPYRDFHAPYFRGYHRDYSHDHHPLPSYSVSPYRDAYENAYRGDDPARYDDAYDQDGSYDHDGSYGDAPVPETSYRPSLPEIYRPPAPRYHIPSYEEVESSAVSESSSASEYSAGSNGWQTEADPTRLAGRLRESAERLQRSLENREDGDVWSDYLQAAAIQELADAMARSRRLADISPAEARAMLANFDGVAANSSLAWVTRLNGFDDTRRALTDLVAVLDGESAAWSESEGRQSGVPLRGPRSDDSLRPVADEELPPPIPEPAAENDPQPVFRGEV